MNHYTIKMHNKKENKWKESVVKKLTFPEAVIAANSARCTMGFSWEIVSIHKVEEGGKGKKNV